MLRMWRPLRHVEERSSGHGGGGGRWLVSYADFVTLMFGFFLILWASASQDPKKLSDLAESFRKAFNSGSMAGQPSSGQILGKGGRLAPDEQSSFQRVSETVGDLVAQMNLAEQLSIGMRREGLVITFSSSLAFEPGTSDLSSPAKDILARLAPSIQSTPGAVLVEGHTDNIAIQTKDFPSNWELSSARAGSVTRFLSETMGIPADKFQVAGFAEYRPLAPNDSRENRSRNRRVEVVLLAPSQESGKPVALPAHPFQLVGAVPAPAPAKGDQTKPEVVANPAPPPKPGVVANPPAGGKPEVVANPPPGAKPVIANPPSAAKPGVVANPPPAANPAGVANPPAAPPPKAIAPPAEKP